MTFDLLPSTALPSPPVLALIAVIVVAAAMVQRGLGMGFGLTASPLLALIDPQLVPAPVLIHGMLTGALGAAAELHAVRWSEVGLGIAGRATGVVAGAAILALLPDRESFSLIFGLLIGLAVLLSVSGLQPRFNGRNLIGMGAVSGLMGTITSVGAPPIALIYQGKPAGEARPTLSAFFSLGCGVSLIGLFASGWAGMGDIRLAVLMLPPVLVGVVLARLLRGRLDRRYRPALLTVAGVAAAMLVLRGIL